MQVNNYGRRIIHFEAATQRELASTFLRFQELHESADDSIRGQVFTVGQVRRAYAAAPTVGPQFDYLGTAVSDGVWQGFNVPDYILQPFYDGLFDPLSDQERAFLELFRGMPKPYYIIGTVERADTLLHELSHALFYVRPTYRKRVLAVWRKYSKLAKAMKKYVLSQGYGNSPYVIADEANAYAGIDGWWLATDPPEGTTADEIMEVSVKIWPIFLSEYRKEVCND